MRKTKAETTKKTAPQKLGACADELGQIRAQLSELHRQEKKLEERRSELEERLIEELPASDADGICGRAFRATIVTSRVPSIKDWDALTRYVKRTGAFELLSRRLSREAVQERWDAKKEVPGVEGFTVKKVSLTKK